MKKTFQGICLSAACLVLASCATPSPSGSREEAVDKAWENFCKAGYCEGHRGVITGRTENNLTVSINQNTRYLTYTVSGTPGHYAAQMRPTANGGRAQP